jgi:hypothetical protein
MSPEARAGAPPVLEASTVASLLTRLAGEASGALLLHGGARETSGVWEGDIDLLVIGDRDTFLRTLYAVADSFGFSPVLQLQRVFTTVETDLLFPRSTSWTIVLVDRRGAAVTVDVTFARKLPTQLIPRASTFGMSGIGDLELIYLILKRLRKRDNSRESWLQISGLARGQVPALQQYLGERSAREIGEAVQTVRQPSLEVVQQARQAMRRRRASSWAAAHALGRGVVIAARRSSRPAGAVVRLDGIEGSAVSALAEALVDWSPFRRVRRLKAPTVGPHLSDWIRIWPITARGGLVISESTCREGDVDSQRRRFRVPPRLGWVLSRLEPRADSLFVLRESRDCPERLNQWSYRRESSPSEHVIDPNSPFDILLEEIRLSFIADRRKRMT